MVSKVARSNKLGLGLVFTGLFTAAMSMASIGCACGVADGGAEPTAEEAQPEPSHAAPSDGRESLPIERPAARPVEKREASLLGEPTFGVEEPAQPGGGEGTLGGGVEGAGAGASGQGGGGVLGGGNGGGTFEQQ